MHSAPSVSYPVGRSFFLACLMGLAWLAGACVVGAWLLSLSPSVGLTAFAPGVVLLAGVLATRSWRASPVGEVCWDGQAWTWRGQAVAFEAVVLDLQACLLVFWRSPGAGTGWLWLERAARPDRWSDLRRAVYSRPRIDSTPFPTDGAQP